MSVSLPPSAAAAELHRRAAALRAFASRLDGAQLNDLPRRAGAETWIGGAADNCLADLVMLRTAIVGSADELRARARSLDQRAAALPTSGTDLLNGTR